MKKIFVGFEYKVNYNQSEKFLYKKISFDYDLKKYLEQNHFIISKLQQSVFIWVI